MKAIAASLILLILLSSIFVPFQIYGEPLSAEVKDLRFYFHYTPSPAYLAGHATHYIMNTSSAFSQPKPFYKPVGQPKIQVDFYMNPNLAASVTFRGDWRVLIWVNGSALHPATWNLQFWERSPDGSLIWDSSAISPDVIGGPTGNPGYVDAPVFAYTLVARGLTHTFQAGNTIEVEVTVNTGATIAVSVWYDSSAYPSFAIFPSEDYAKPYFIKTYDVNGTEKAIFSIFWGDSQRIVIVRCDVRDPFGGYDISSVKLSITDPIGRPVLSNQSMVKVSGTLTSYSNVYQGSWVYPATANLGTYRVQVYSIDNNGYIESLETTFSMGVQFKVNIRALDSHNLPLVLARVVVQIGALTYAQGLTNGSGWITLILFTADYNVTVFWQDVAVASKPIKVIGPESFLIICHVYYPALFVKDHSGQPLELAWVFVTFPNGSSPAKPYIMDAIAKIVFTQVPGGKYGFRIFWKDVLVNDTVVLILSDGPYNLATLVFRINVQALDSKGRPTAGAYVSVTSEKGIVFDFNVTNSLGQVLYKLPIGAYTLKTYWEGVLVNSTGLEANFDGVFKVKCQVYDVTVNVTDNSRRPLRGAYVVFSSIQGKVFGFSITGASGLANFTLPIGTYKLKVYYNTTYWLSQISNYTEITIPVISTIIVPITITNYPPPLWLTIGFWVITTPIVTVAVIAFLFFFLRRRKALKERAAVKA